MITDKRRKSLSVAGDDLVRLCREGDLPRLRRVLEDEDVYQQKVKWLYGRYECPLLFEAVEHSQIQMVQYLLCKSVEVNCRVSHKGNCTPLHIAVSKGNEEMAKMLLDHRASTNIINDNGETAMYRATKARKRNMEYLLRSYCVVSRAREMCESNAIKSDLPTKLNYFRSEMDQLGRNFHQDCANTCLLYFAKCNLHTLSARCILAGADNFEQATIFAEKTYSIKTLSQLLLCQAAKQGDYTRVSELFSDPPGLSYPWYLLDVQRHLTTYFYSDPYLRKPALMIAFRSGHIYTASTLLKHSRLHGESGGFHLDWSDLSLRYVHEIWMHAVAPWVQHLSLSYNRLTSLPNSFLSLQNIRVLDLSHNNLSGTLIFIDLMRLETLEKLNLSDNQIRELPSNTLYPALLSYLDISRNKLTNLPVCISDAKLQCLICQGNSFSHLPSPLFQLHSLKILDFADNPSGSFSDVDSIMSRFSTDVKFISPDGEIHRSRQHEEPPIPPHLLRKQQQQQHRPAPSILSTIKKLNVIKRPTFRGTETRRVCLTLLGERQLQVSLANKLIQGTHYERQKDTQHDSLINFSWIFSPNFLRGKKISFNTFVLKNSPKYALFLSCFLPETALIALLHDPSQTQKDTEANLIRPLASLLTHVKRYVLLVFLHEQKSDELMTELLFKERRENLMKMLEKFRVVDKMLECTFCRVMDLENTSPSELVEVQKAIYDIAGVLFQDPHSLLSIPTPAYHSDVELILSSLKEGGETMDRRSLETSIQKLLGADFTLQDAMLYYLREIGAVFYFNVPLHDLSLYVFVSPSWLLQLILHISDVITSHNSPVISETMLKEKLAPKCERAFSASLSILTQIFQILVQHSLLVPIKPSLYLLPTFRHLASPTKLPLQGDSIYQMEFKRENIDYSFWHLLVAQVMKKLDLGPNTELNFDSLCFERSGAQFRLMKIRERTEFDGFSISTTGSSDSFDILATVCSLVHTFIYQNFYFTSRKDELCKTLQLCIPCPTCLSLSIHSPKHFVLESVLLCLHEEQQLHCSQHDCEVSIENIRPDVYFHDMPLHLRTLKFHPKSILRRSNTLGGSTDHIYEYLGQMVTIRIYNFNSLTPLLPFYTLSNEVRLLHSLQHDNVVKLIGFNADALYVILEQLPQMSLASFLEFPSIHLDRLLVFSFARQIISAIDYLHSRDVVYRGLHPGTLLITSLDYMDAKNLILSDFRESAFLTPLGVRGRVNRAEYQAPEMADYAGTQWYSEQVDVYAFGCVLRAILATVHAQQSSEPIFSSDASEKSRARWSIPNLTESMMSVTSAASIQTSPPQSPPGYKLYADMMQRSWYPVLRDRPQASLLHFQLSRLEFHLFQTAQQPPDPVLIHFLLQVYPSEGPGQVWAVGDEAHLSSLECELSVLYVYDQRMQNVLFSIDVLNQIVAASFCVAQCLVWTVERQTRCRNRFFTPLAASTITAYSPMSFNRVHQFALEEEVVSLNTSRTSLFLGLSSSCVLLYKFEGLFSQPTHRIPLHSDSPPMKVRCIEVLEDGCIWVGCGACVSVYREQDTSLIPCKELRVELGGEFMSEGYISHLLADQGAGVMWVGDSRGCLILYDLHTLEKCRVFDELCGINREAMTNTSSKQLEIQSMCLSRDLLWVGVTSGHILLINRYKVISWVRAHKSKVKCLFHLAPVIPPGMLTANVAECQKSRDSVISTGTGCHIDPKMYQDMNYCVKWEALGKDRLELLENKCKRTSFLDELHSFI